MNISDNKKAAIKYINDVEGDICTLQNNILAYQTWINNLPDEISDDDYDRISEEEKIYDLENGLEIITL